VTMSPAARLKSLVASSRRSAKKTLVFRVHAKKTVVFGIQQLPYTLAKRAPPAPIGNGGCGRWKNSNGEGRCVAN